MRNVLLSLILIPSFSWAGMPVLGYKTAECRLLLEDKIVRERSVSLMTLTVEDHLGRFAEIQFGDDQKKIQYQILIEDDIQSISSDSILVLQNLMVDSLESSSEFSAKEVSWVRIAQGEYSVTCNLKP